jgi:hypothetical protein
MKHLILLGMSLVLVGCMLAPGKFIEVDAKDGHTYTLTQMGANCYINHSDKCTNATHTKK